MSCAVFDRRIGCLTHELEMDEQNLDIYGHEPIPWSRALQQLEAQAGEEGRGRTCWLATAALDGSPQPRSGGRAVGRRPVLLH